jgi:asparagine synthase (glutamine-hydrolysing)
MCGITGFIDTTQSNSSDNLINIVTRMSDQIRHRGPDDSGSWIDAETGIALGFRRLAIRDLTPTGHQPMLSADGRFVIVFNGEIYNFANLKEELFSLGHTFCGTSDTEVMLAAIHQWGLKAAVESFNGMFAFALWDRSESTLSLVRDRLGIKPLYYGWSDKNFLFGSELKSLHAHPDFAANINRDVLSMYLRYGYIPAPHTIYQKIYKLPPASILTIKTDQDPASTSPIAYWSVHETVENGQAYPFDGDDNEAIDALEKILTHSIGLRMIADVPLGAFLSGGIDSSTVVALMQKQSSQPVRTFTIGFEEAGFDEAGYAKTIAHHLGTAHTELYVSSSEAQAIIPRLPTLYDEPFADPSQIPTFLVSALARMHVTVSLSGDGGDELFGGYNRYLWVDRIWQRSKNIHPVFRNTIANGLNLLRPQDWARIIQKTIPGLPNPADKVQKMIKALTASSPEAIYLDLVSNWKNPDNIVIGGFESHTLLNDRGNWLSTPTFTEKMMALDQVSYLPDDVLAKVDRASMGNSLEVRAPFLDDHKTVEFAWKLPLNMKIRDGQGKWILRQVLYRHVPREMVDRPKMGFGVPIDSWLRGPLRPWSENLLNENRLKREGYFDPSGIRRKWQEHLSGANNWQYDLWNILMFQAWLEETKS